LQNGLLSTKLDIILAHELVISGIISIPPAFSLVHEQVIPGITIPHH
jgi:hypothetical protein